ncbi:MAG TPA: HAD-IIB family hydrolase [Candidatus Saccharimonadales bacterium]|nr:HAD-IIB family hydrolase [Candidatus Saccharimonadales bacterium]
MKTIALFDIDGTLTLPRHRISNDMIDLLKQLQTKMNIGVIGGSDLVKQKEQLGDVLDWIDYSFSENGVVAYHHQTLIHQNNIRHIVNDDTINNFIDFCLHYIDKLDIPVKRSKFIECRTGMINISPIGRDCTQHERDEFDKYDQKHRIRQTMVDVLKKKFGDIFTFAIGGQISIDVYPHGWDKTYCLTFLNDFNTIYFYGDKTEEGGNDYTLYCHPRVIGYHVDCPLDTYQFIKQLLL